MKQFWLILCFGCFLIIASCKKDDNGFGYSLAGRWKVIESRVGDGSLGEWQKQPKENERQVTFKSNGTLAGNLFERYGKYIITDSTTIKLTEKGNEVEQFYGYKINAEGVLELWPKGPIVCIEGCSIRLIKQI